MEALTNGVGGIRLHSDDDQCAARQRTELLALNDCHKWQTDRNLGSCLKQFVAVEILTGKNRYECERCCLPANKKVSYFNRLETAIRIVLSLIVKKEFR